MARNEFLISTCAKEFKLYAKGQSGYVRILNCSFGKTRRNSQPGASSPQLEPLWLVADKVDVCLPESGLEVIDCGEPSTMGL